MICLIAILVLIAADQAVKFWTVANPVSYTHLTLPTILLV